MRDAGGRSAVGGIPEVVVDGETGLLVPLAQQTQSPFEPLDPARFSADLAAAINRLLGDPTLRERMGRDGRQRVEGLFAWSAIARQTIGLYERVAAGRAFGSNDEQVALPRAGVH